MNAASILRLALFNLDAVNQDSTTDPLFRQSEMLVWANWAKDEAEMALRTAKEDFNLLVLQSNDAAFTWCGVTFNPATLQLTSASKYVPLPPDLLTLKRIRCITSGYENTVFREVDIATDEGKQAAAFGVQSTRDSELLWDVVGENTLFLPYGPTSTIDIEISYIARSGPMQIYTTGTVTTVNASASVSGGSTLWVANELRTNLELIVSADATAPKIVSQTTGGTWVDPATEYPPVQSIDSDGGLTLAKAWPSAGVAGRGYMLATVPSLPVEHHYVIVDGLVARMKLKAENKGSDAYFGLAELGAKKLKSDVTERQMDTVRHVEEWIAG